MTKQHILDEIKRVTRASGGVPPGRSKFFRETGIKETDWYGKIWARWGDALREAGFVPNQLRGAYEKTDLLDKYAKLSCELAKLPTNGDLRLKARSDSKFPAYTTFENRFGTKRELVQRLLEYCQGREGYEDVAGFCEEYLVANQDTLQPSDRALTMEIGFVYLARSGRHYKIGKTNSAGRREYELAIQLPEKTTTVHVIRTDDPTGIEAYWHQRFRAKRKNGEWFTLETSDIAAFKRRKFM